MLRGACFVIYSLPNGFGLTPQPLASRGAKQLKFYNLKTRSHVEIPESEITKVKMVRATKTGEQTRYAVKATHEGTPLTKFVSEKDYNALTNVKEG